MEEISELDEEIRKKKEELDELRRKRWELIHDKTLYNEGQEFRKKGHSASQTLRIRNRKLYHEKCMKLYGRFVDMNWQYHSSKWETASRKACYKASNGRAYSALHLSDEEFMEAKRLAKEYADEWEKYWTED